MADEYIFLRKSSGLVKAAKPVDVLIYNTGLISVGIAVTLCHFFIPSNYFGANIVWSEIISGIFMLVIALTFWLWSIAIPRTGGIYAYVSRAIHPLIGFGVSFIDSIVWLFYNTFAASYLVYIGLSPALFAIGIDTNNQSLIDFAIKLQTPWSLLVIGSIGIIISGWILANGMKSFFRIQKILFSIAIIGTIAAIYVLHSSTTIEFTKAFANAFKISSNSALYNHLNSFGSVSFSLKMTILAAVWPLLSFVGSIFSVNMASEIQDVKRSQFFGIFGSIVIALVFMTLLSMSLDHVVTPQMQSTIAQYYGNPTGNQLAIAPYFTLLVAIMAKSPLLIILVCAGFFCWAFLWLPATLNYFSKALLAWSFDRLTPAFVGYVHPKKFTPVNAILIAVTLNIIFLVLYIFIPFFNSLILVLAAMIAWIPVMLAAIIFPYRKKSLYEQTAIAKNKIFGLPTISVVGTFGLIAVSTLTVFLFSDSVAAGPNVNTFGTIAILFSIALIWYYSVKKIRAKENIDISKAFDEIPID